jgi:hypothetical protein
LLAADASRGRSTRTFVRIHAAELTKAARTSEALLAKGRTPDAHSLAALARRTAADLDRLSQSGSDRATQRRLAADLDRAAKNAEQIGQRL